jgi:hypothetical protein
MPFRGWTGKSSPGIDRRLIVQIRNIRGSISIALRNALYAPDRQPGPITEAGCWARRKLFELADIASNARKGKLTTISPIALEAVSKFDAIFALERSINGLSPEARVAARRRDIAPLVNELIEWMKRERAKLSRHNEVAKLLTTCSSASMSSRASLRMAVSA